jgi:hypothetical protein
MDPKSLRLIEASDNIVVEKKSQVFPLHLKPWAPLFIASRRVVRSTRLVAYGEEA